MGSDASAVAKLGVRRLLNDEMFKRSAVLKDGIAASQIRQIYEFDRRRVEVLASMFTLSTAVCEGCPEWVRQHTEGAAACIGATC